MPNPIPSEARISVPKAVVWQQLEGESVILNLESGQYFSLNEVGSDMWRAISDAQTIDGAVRRLLETYDVAEDELRTDLNHLIHDLLEQGLLNVAHDEEGAA